MYRPAVLLSLPLFLSEGFVGTRGVAALGSIVYLTRFYDIEIIDALDPAAPRVIGNLRTEGYFNGDISIAGDRIFYRSGAGIETAPLQCGDEPTSVQVLDLDARGEEDGICLTWRVAADARFLGFVVLRNDGTATNDLPLNETSPIPGSGPFEYHDRAVLANKSYDYRVAALRPDGRCDLFGPVSARWTHPRSLTLGPAVPNPTIASVWIPFLAPSDEEARFEIFDPKGRLVRGWLTSDIRPGRNLTQWDGRDGAGRAAPSGVYYIRLTQGTHSSALPILLLRP